AGNADLYADVTESLRHLALRGFHDIGKIRSVGVAVTIGGLAAFAARKLVDGHAGLTALNVPQRLIHTADRIIQNRAVFPVGAVVTGLPDVLNPVRRLTDQERLEVPFHRGLDQVGALRESGATIPVKAILVGRDLDHREPHAGGLAFNDADILDFRDGHGARGASHLFLRLLFAGSGQAEQSRNAERPQKVPTFD